jgi:uncharacterized membrane protein
MQLWLWFVLAVVLCWGAYVPTIHAGQLAIGGANRSLWSFLIVGLAYFLVAVLVPGVMLAARDGFAVFPSTRGFSVSFLAGVLGAVGALCVILALMNGGSPQTVPPLIFGGAPIVATLVAMALHRPERTPDIRFFIGIGLAACGAAMVLYYKPK